MAGITVGTFFQSLILDIVPFSSALTLPSVCCCHEKILGQISAFAEIELNAAGNLTVYNVSGLVLLLGKSFKLPNAV